MSESSKMSKLSKSQKKYVKERVHKRALVTGIRILEELRENGEDEPVQAALDMMIGISLMGHFDKAHVHWVFRAHHYKLKGQSKLERQMLDNVAMATYAGEYSSKQYCTVHDVDKMNDMLKKKEEVYDSYSRKGRIPESWLLRD